jgi:hypothetical protein
LRQDKKPGCQVARLPGCQVARLPVSQPRKSRKVKGLRATRPQRMLGNPWQPDGCQVARLPGGAGRRSCLAFVARREPRAPSPATVAGPCVSLVRLAGVKLRGLQALRIACPTPASSATLKVRGLQNLQDLVRALHPWQPATSPLHHPVGEHADHSLVRQRRRSAPGRLPAALRRERAHALARAGRPDRCEHHRIRLRRPDPDRRTPPGCEPGGGQDLTLRPAAAPGRPPEPGCSR